MHEAVDTRVRALVIAHRKRLENRVIKCILGSLGLGIIVLPESLVAFVVQPQFPLILGPSHVVKFSV